MKEAVPYIEVDHGKRRKWRVEWQPASGIDRLVDEIRGERQGLPPRLQAMFDASWERNKAGYMWLKDH